MKIVNNIKVKVLSSIHVHSIPNGQVFYATTHLSSTKGLFLKIYNGFVDLNDCGKIWTDANFEVYNYQPVAATLTLDSLT